MREKKSTHQIILNDKNILIRAQTKSKNVEGEENGAAAASEKSLNISFYCYSVCSHYV